VKAPSLVYLSVSAVVVETFSFPASESVAIVITRVSSPYEFEVRIIPSPKPLAESGAVAIVVRAVSADSALKP